jgi:hypothetical protein
MRVFLRMLRAYQPALLVTAAAVAALSIGAPTSQPVLTGAGIALLGFAAGSWLDLAKEHRAKAAQAAKDRDHDLDETRRLAYAALIAARLEGEDPMLAATLVNALGYHSRIADPADAAEQLLNPDRAERRRWLQDLITQINDASGT